MQYTLKESDKEKAEGTNGAGALQQKLLESRSIVISGEINQELAQKVITQMILLQSVSNDPIKLYIGWRARGSPSSWRRKKSTATLCRIPAL